MPISSVDFQTHCVVIACVYWKGEVTLIDYENLINLWILQTHHSLGKWNVHKLYWTRMQNAIYVCCNKPALYTCNMVQTSVHFWQTSSDHHHLPDYYFFFSIESHVLCFVFIGNNGCHNVKFISTLLHMNLKPILFYYFWSWSIQCTLIVLSVLFTSMHANNAIFSVFFFACFIFRMYTHTQVLMKRK